MHDLGILAIIQELAAQESSTGQVKITLDDGTVVIVDISIRLPTEGE